MTIGERIKQRRLELGLSQEDLAKRLGNKSRASVCTVEKDKEDLTTDRIRKYAEALETTPSYLMGWEDRNGNPINDKVSRETINRALEVYEKYRDATPEIQQAIEALLKIHQSKP